jgi:uncharacterized Zn finger protein
MEAITLKAKSSAGDFYQVVIKLKDQLLRLKCDCVAGKFGQLCKHKLDLLKGESQALYDLEEMPQLNLALVWIQASTYPNLIDRLTEAEARLNEQKQVVKAIRKELEMAMKKGA